jgi:probable O-glycosylation ligase (exosortase A-associated)
MLLAGLLFSLFLEYVSPGSFFPVIKVTKIGTIVPLLVFVLVLLKPEPVSNGKLLSHTNTKWLLFLLFLVIVSIATSDVTIRSVDIFRRVFGHIVWFVIIVKVVTDLDKLKLVFKVMVWSHVLILLLNPSVILNPATRSYLRAGSFLGDGNDFALSVSIVLPMCLVLLNSATTRSTKMLYAGGLAILVLAIIGTQSRGASLALAGSLGFLWWVSKRRLTGMLLLGIAFVGVMVFAPPEYFQRMESIADYEQEGSARARIVAWKAAVRMAKAHPVTGVGAGHFPIALGRNFRPPEWGGRNLPWMTAHSSYFLILGELGIPGIVFLLALLIGNYRRLRRLTFTARGDPNGEHNEFADVFLKLTASLIAFGIGGAFLSASYYPHIFVLAGLITAATFTYERALEQQRKAHDASLTAKTDGAVNSANIEVRQ